MIIFGWGRGKSTDHGPVLPTTCSNCKNQTWLHYVSSKKWFSLFFIPLIPYGHRHLLLCPICTRGILLFSDAQIAAVAPLPEAYAQLHSQQISQAEYDVKAAALTRLLTPVEVGGAPAPPPLPPPASPLPPPG